MSVQHAPVTTIDQPPRTMHAPPRIEAEAAEQRSRKFLFIFAVIALTIGLLAVWLSQGASERRALEGLPGNERHALYERTLQNLRGACATARPE
ncbi:MAG TPA: hypothetical protein VG963_21775, partial [Polyangiaceae bacterium]|nr:hypothetical protein [Polyangiaceae bacterium]